MATLTDAQKREQGSICNATTLHGNPCRAYSNASGMCPTHDGKTPRNSSPSAQTRRRHRRAAEWIQSRSFA